MRMAIHFFSVVLLTTLPIALVSGSDAIPETIDFNRDVRPILSDNCYFCHGPDENHRKADLRIDVREAVVDSAAVIPGKPDESELITRILSTDPDKLMPPPDSNKKLDARQQAILKRWVEQGAEYANHWAYEPPVKPLVPEGRQAIDYLVEQRLSSLGIQPLPRADRRVLIRRLYFDLVGLPPTPEAVAAFVNDTSPDAYERLVNELLDSPHYGERMAIGWLDVVRFADTIGYHSDTPRNIWPYRDWVIDAFNKNKPFDRFTIEQLAGDLLPDANQETRVGSAFNRLLLSTEEGGAQAKDYESRMLTDRVRAVGTVWLGQTIGCAQCHDHKFDPITMRDFYSMGAFFADIQEAIIGRREDGVLVLKPDEQAKLEELDRQLAASRDAVNAITPMLEVAQQQWEADLVTYSITFPELAEGSKASPEDRKKAEEVIRIAKVAADQRKPDEKQAMMNYFRSKATQLYAKERDALAKAESERNNYHASLPKCLVSISTPNKRTVRILPRGDWMVETGEVMKPAFPGYLPKPETEGQDLTRLDLARWIVAPENPLTARTFVNRLWRQFFGTGLSKVVDDLGAQGEPPVNAALLDWLASEFVDSGWDMKHMVRVMVTSDAYQRASTVTPELLAADPFNRECARQSRFRLEAELVRDNALAVGGLLVRDLGGPSVKPYQPERYWENLNFPTRDYPADKGHAQYRRGLYTWWQRSFLHPSMLAFDAPSREECAADRNRSNIPQQALVLLNDPTYVEAARALAARIFKECEGSDDQRITWAWQQTLQREPNSEETQVLQSLLEQHRKKYRDDPASADALLTTGFAPIPDGLEKVELAAWTHIARVMLNLHETISRY